MNLQQTLKKQAIENLQKSLNPWEPVLLVGNRWNKNLWDELILAGLIRLLWQIGFEPNKIIVPSADVEFSQNFLKQFLKELPVIIPEIPKGIRSSLKYTIKGFRGLKTYLLPRQVILGGWEILTLETKGSFRYWWWSLLPLLKLKKPQIIIMGGVTPPNTKKEKAYFNHILHYTKACLCRDFESIQKLKDYGFENTNFVMDTSFFVLDDRKSFKAAKPQNKYTVNIHHFSHQFLDDLIQFLKKKNPSQIEFAPAGLGNYDKDLEYAKLIEQKINKQIAINFWHQDFFEFLKRLGTSQEVVSARLHLFLIARYIWLPTKFFAYQTKLTKMDQVLSTLDI